MFCLSSSAGEYQVTYNHGPKPYLREGYEVHGNCGDFSFFVAFFHKYIITGKYGN